MPVILSPKHQYTTSTGHMSQPLASSVPGTADEDALAKRRRAAGATLPIALCMCNRMVLCSRLCSTCLQHASSCPMLCGVVHACCNTILEWHFASSDVCGAFKALVVQLFDRRPRCLRGAAAAFESCAEDGGNSTELVHEI